MQEREYYRLKKILDVFIQNKNKDVVKVFVEDISGKGIKIITDEIFHRGDIFPLKLL